jgi:hypothetical protein
MRISPIIIWFVVFNKNCMLDWGRSGLTFCFKTRKVILYPPRSHTLRYPGRIHHFLFIIYLPAQFLLLTPTWTESSSCSQLEIFRAFGSLTIDVPLRRDSDSGLQIWTVPTWNRNGLHSAHWLGVKERERVMIVLGRRKASTLSLYCAISVSCKYKVHLHSKDISLPSQRNRETSWTHCLL